MNRFYKVAVDKRPIGTAIQHREPRLHGEVILRVTDATTGGDYKLVVVDADDAQHARNQALPDVETVEEREALSLAKRYQPPRTMEVLNPFTRQREKIETPALDLRQFFGGRGKPERPALPGAPARPAKE